MEPNSAKDPKIQKSAMKRWGTRCCSEWDLVGCSCSGLETGLVPGSVGIRVAGQLRRQQRPLGGAANT